MSIPILSPEVLAGLAVVHPAGLGGTLYGAFSRARNGGPLPGVTALLFWTETASYLTIILCVAVFVPSVLVYTPWTPSAAPFFALLIAPGAMALEIAVLSLAVFLATGKRPGGLGLHGAWQGSAPAVMIATAVVVAALEEIVFRQIWFQLFGAWLPLWSVLALSSLAYGLNHLRMGPLPVISKTANGLVYGTAYLAFGRSILIPVIIHVAHNLILLALAGMSRKVRRAG